MTDEQMRELAGLYLFSELATEPWRRFAHNVFKEKYDTYCKVSENNKYIDENLDAFIREARPRISALCAKSPPMESTEEMEKYFDEQKIFFELQKAVDAADSGEETRAKWLEPKNLATQAFKRHATPISWLKTVGYNPQYDWSSDVKTDRKAYIFSCFSEIAYLKYTKYNVPDNARYKLVPSEALEYLQTQGLEFDLETVLREVTGGEGVAVTVAEPGRGFVYATFNTPQFVVVAVRGTNSLSELLFLDFNAEPLEFGGEIYHRGFYNEAKSAMAMLRGQNTLRDAEGTDKPVYFTGHSMGAAVAWIFKHIWAGKHKTMTPYIYASPRIGNEAVNKKTTVYPYIRKNDPVPYMPPFSWGYRDSNDAIVVNPEEENQTEWQRYRNILNNHTIENDRKELGAKTKDPQFDADSYFTALFVEMIDVHRQLGQILPYGVRRRDSRNP
jgi:hypothetical protein